MTTTVDRTDDKGDGSTNDAVRVGGLPDGIHDAQIGYIRSMLAESQRLWVEAADAMVGYATHAAGTGKRSVEDILHACIVDREGAVDFYRLCEIRLRQRVKSETVTVDGK